MSLEPVLVAGVWRQARNPLGAFSPENPPPRRPCPNATRSLERTISRRPSGRHGGPAPPAAARRRRPVPGAVRRPDRGQGR